MRFLSLDILVWVLLLTSEPTYQDDVTEKRSDNVSAFRPMIKKGKNIHSWGQVCPSSSIFSYFSGAGDNPLTIKSDHLAFKELLLQCTIVQNWGEEPVCCIEPREYFNKEDQNEPQNIIQRFIIGFNERFLTMFFWAYKLLLSSVLVAIYIIFITAFPVLRCWKSLICYTIFLFFIRDSRIFKPGDVIIVG